MKILALATAFLGVAFAAQAQNWAADVPLLSCDGIPCIDAMLGNGVTGRMMIDSGDLISVVDSKDGAAIGFGPDDMKDGQIVKAAHTTATVAGARLDNVPAVAFPLDADIAKTEMPHVRGSLTYTAFKDRILQIDFVRRRVRISAVLAAPVPCAAPCADLHLITFGKQGPNILVADGFALNGQPITAQIDTAYTGSLLIYDASVDKLGLADLSKAAAKSDRFAFTDGGVDMRKSTAQSVTFGGQPLAANATLYFATPGVHQPDALFDGTVGLVLMQDKIVTFDLHDMKFAMAAG